MKHENGKDRCLCAVRELSQAFALAVPHEEALRIRDDVAFVQAVQAVLAKRAPGDARPEEELDHAVIRQITSRAVAPEGVVDIFAAAGLPKPDISILSDDFLAEVRGMPQRNLAVELLRKLLQGETAYPAAQERGAGEDPSPRCWSRRSAATRTGPGQGRRAQGQARDATGGWSPGRRRCARPGAVPIPGTAIRSAPNSPIAIQQSVDLKLISRRYRNILIIV